MIETIDMSILRLEINDLLYIITYYLGRDTAKIAQECLEYLCLVYLFPILYKSNDLVCINSLDLIIKKIETLECNCDFNYNFTNDGSEIIKLISILKLDLRA
ncbi:hypothetical protein [Candidatus Clostridium radicumherbarum]|uniref:Uncharacterized protein n=1 Tax=Candidatus Clostridium radicumherbarum TaxID=3381662 RepID=A0ABW8TWV3_9CLOT